MLLPFLTICPYEEKLCAGVPILYVHYSRPLTRPGLFNGEEAQVNLFESCLEIYFLLGEDPAFLCLVKKPNNFFHHCQLHLNVSYTNSLPCFESFSHLGELDVKAPDCICGFQWFCLGVFDHVEETRETKPVGLKSEAFESGLVCFTLKDKWVVVRGGGRPSMHVCGGENLFP
jgi:hypothetical protein